MLPTPSAPELAAIRDRWLTATLQQLASLDGVVGVALVGSLGRRDEDDWSDVDLLVVAEQVSCVSRSELTGFGTMAFSIDARRNVRAGASSYAAVYVIDGLPLGTDWYIWPKSVATWPADATVVVGGDEVPRSRLAFATLNEEGERQPPAPPTREDIRLGQLRMITVAGKHVARGSTAAPQMIENLGGSAPAMSQAEQLRELRRLSSLYGRPRDRALGPVHAYLDIVERALRQTGSP